MAEDGARRIAVLGAGAWGTALAIQAARAGHAVGLWARDPARAAALAATRENAPYLPGATLLPTITPTADAAAALAGATLVLVVVPVQFLRPVLTDLRPAIEAGGAPLVVCSKGV